MASLISTASFSSASSSSLGFHSHSQYDHEETIRYSLEDITGDSVTPWLLTASSSPTAAGEGSKHSLDQLEHAGSGTEPNLNNIPDNPTVATVNTSFTGHHKDFDTPKSTLQQATVYTAFSDIPSSNVPNSTDPSEAYEAGQQRTAGGPFPTSCITPAQGCASAGNAYAHLQDRFQDNNGVCERSALQLPANEHHDSSEHAEVPFREGIAVQQRQQVQKEKNRIQQQIHRNNIRFAVQGARAVAAGQKQEQSQSAERVPLRDGLGNPSGGAGTSSGNIAGTTRKNKSQFLLSDKSATRAYVDRAEAWFGEGVLEGVSQLVQGNQTKNRKPQQHLSQLERPVSPTPPPLPIATAARSTETALNQLKRCAHSPDSVGSNKRSRWATSSSVVESEMLSDSTAAGGAHDGVASDEEEDDDDEEEEPEIEYNLEIYASLLQRLIKGKSALGNEERHQIQTFISSPIPEHIADVMIARRGGSNALTIGTNSSSSSNASANASTDVETQIWHSILYIAKSAVGDLGLAKNEEDALRRAAKRIVRKT